MAKLAERRVTVMADTHFADPSWLILLHLYVQESEGRPLSITDACMASNAPASTALRHTRLLIDNGQIVTEPDPGDLRRTWVRLSPAMGDIMEALLDRTSTDLLRAFDREALLSVARA